MGPFLTRKTCALFVLLQLDCNSAKPSSTLSVVDAGSPENALARTLEDLARAEGIRNTAAISDDLTSHPNPAVRRQAAQALARIPDPPGQTHARAGRSRALHDEDEKTAAWGAYGLGFFCRDNPDETVAELATRAATLLTDPNLDAGQPSIVMEAIARALGRCATKRAETLLRAWLASSDLRERAFLGLGDLATQRRSLSEETTRALWESLSLSSGACYALGRLPSSALNSLRDVPESRERGVAQLRRHVEDSSGALCFRVLGKFEDHRGDLRAFVLQKGRTFADRAEALRWLLDGEVREETLSQLLAGLLGVEVPKAGAEVTIGSESLDAAIQTGTFNLLLNVLRAPKSEPGSIFKALVMPLTRVPKLADRFSSRRERLRCVAAGVVSWNNPFSDLVAACGDKPGSREIKLAELASIARGNVRNDRLEFLQSSLVDADPIVVEAAAAIVPKRTELEKKAVALLSPLLARKEQGVVAAALDVFSAHPSLGTVIASREIRDALDPRAPLPPIGANPEKEVHPVLEAALTTLTKRTFESDAIETVGSLFGAIGALRVESLRGYVRSGCTFAHPAIHRFADDALRAFGGDEKCGPKEVAPSLTPATSARLLWSQGPLAQVPTAPASVRVELETTVGPLSLTLDEPSAPMHRAAIEALVRKKFYDGVSVHRVVPGFVAQFGDPGGDGYGGSGSLLPCETSTTRFQRGSLGMALSGRDTGSSQMFVTVTPQPHLDGQYTYLGKAEGPWDALAETDVILSARVVPSPQK